MRRASALAFDEDVPGFHCYGADLCLRAAARGWRVLAVDAPVRHLSTGRLDASFDRSADWLLSRWGSAHGHVLPTPAALIADPVRASLARLLLIRWRRRRDRHIRHRVPAGRQLEWAH